MSIEHQKTLAFLCNFIKQWSLIQTIITYISVICLNFLIIMLFIQFKKKRLLKKFIFKQKYCFKLCEVFAEKSLFFTILNSEPADTFTIF